MKFDNHIGVIISLVSLILITLARSLDSSPSSSQENEIYDEVKKAFGPVLDEAEEEFGPISSLDLDEVKEAFSPSIDEAEKEFGPISSLDLDKVKEAFSPSIDKTEETLGPISSEDEAKEKLGPIASTLIDDAKEVLGPISPSTVNEAVDEAKEMFGPDSSEILDKAKEHFNSFASWISQNKEDITSEAQKEPGPNTSSNSDKANETSSPNSSSNDTKEAQTPLSPSSQFLDEAKQKIGSFTSLFTRQNKEDLSSSLLEEAQKEFGPISSIDIENIKDALPSISPSTLEEAKDFLGPGSFETRDKEEISLNSFSVLDEAQKEFGPVSSSSSDLDALSPISSYEGSAPISPPNSREAIGSFSSKDVDDTKSSLSFQTKEEMSSDSPSVLEEAQKELGPVSSFYDTALSPDASTPVLAPVSPSTLDEAKHAIGSISSKAMDVAKDKFDSISSFFSKSKMEISHDSEINLHSSSSYFDHDVALAIESLIKQAQSNSQLVIEEGNKLLSEATIDSSDTGNCMKKCMDNYESCNKNLNKAMEDLKARDTELLTNDVIAVEGEVSACRKCFLENSYNQSPFKDLMEATIKATHECLNVLDNNNNSG